MRFNRILLDRIQRTATSSFPYIFFISACDTPGELSVIGSSVCESGNEKPCAVEDGQAMRVTTGAPVPNGADSVIPVEETTLLESSDDVRFLLR